MKIYCYKVISQLVFQLQEQWYMIYMKNIYIYIYIDK